MQPNDLGARVRAARKKKGMGQVDFAAAVGVSRSATVSMWETGRQIPTIENLRSIAEVADVDPAEWFGDWVDQDARDRAASDGRRNGDGELPAYNEEREEDEMARIGALPDPLLRAMERESIAAVIRAQGMRDACRAARIEAEKAPDRSATTAPYRITQMKELPRPQQRKKKRGSNGGGLGE